MSSTTRKKYKRSKKVQVRSAEITSTVDCFAKEYGCKQEEVPDEIKDRLDKSDMVKQYALIIHDKDIDPENDEAVSPHIHIAVVFKYGTTFAAIATMIGMPESSVEKIKQQKICGNKRVADVGGLLSYLTHRNALEKHQYDDSEVIASDGWDWKSVRSKSEKAREEHNPHSILDKIASGQITKGNITDIVDLDSYLLRKKSIDYAFEYRSLQMASDHDREIIVIYIQGEKGTGKTTLAKDFCIKKGLTFFISGGSKDPFQDYGDQEVVILDDVRPSAFGPEEWLKILDNNTRSSVSSRYHNKNLSAKYIILTSTISIDHFFDIYKTEDIQQLYRRIKLSIVITKTEIHYYEYKSELEEYKLIKKDSNYIREKFKCPDLTDEQKSDLFQGFSNQSSYIQLSLFDYDKEGSEDEQEGAHNDV